MAREKKIVWWCVWILSTKHVRAAREYYFHFKNEKRPSNLQNHYFSEPVRNRMPQSNQINWTPNYENIGRDETRSVFTLEENGKRVVTLQRVRKNKLKW